MFEFIIVCLVLYALFEGFILDPICKAKSERFKNTIENFTINFIQPLIKKDEKYQIFEPVSFETVKIYTKLLKDEFNTSYISDFCCDYTQNFSQNDSKFQILQHNLDLSEQKYQKTYDRKWTVYHSRDFLNELLFKALYEKFVKQFAIDNPDCENDWYSIRECYFNTFECNTSYLIYISEYFKHAHIDNLNFKNNIEILIYEYQKYINEIDTHLKANEYKKLIINDEILETSKDINMIDSMSGIEFEEFLKDLFQEKGYKVSLTQNTGDQGADLILDNINEKIIVQAKRYSTKVSNKAIQEAAAAIKYYNANRAIVITNNYFTNSAIALAAANKIELWDRDVLIKHIKYKHFKL